MESTVAHLVVPAPGKKIEEAAGESFKPCFFFFYGSLMDPEILQGVLDLPGTPMPDKGKAVGLSMKMWGVYPAVISDGKGTVSGIVWKVVSKQQLLRLQEYETSAYKLGSCDVELTSGEVLLGCQLFLWGGESDSWRLREGTFDLEKFQKQLRPDVDAR